MISQQETIHYLGQSIGYPQKDYKLHHRRQKLSHTLLEVSNKMSKKTHSADSNSKETEESIKAYREAAKADAWLFGDYDAYEAYDINTKKVSEEDESV